MSTATSTRTSADAGAAAARRGGIWRRLLAAGHLPVAGLALLVLFTLVRFWDPAPVETLRLQAFDLYQRAQPRAARQPEVLVVDIDEASLARLGQWPWPRDLLAALVERIAAGRPRAVGLDILLAEPDRLSPERLARDLRGLAPELRAALADLPQSDATLAAALTRTPAVLSIAGLTDSATAPERVAPAGIVGDPPTPYLPSFAGALRNLDILERSAAGIGAVSLTPGRDGIVRDLPLVLRLGGRVVPALTVEMLRVGAGRRSYVIRVGRLGIESVAAGTVEAATDANGRLILRYSRHDPRRFVSAADVLGGSVDVELFRDRHVLVGASATALWDLRATPTGEVLPGVEIQAQALESLIDGDYLHRPPHMLGIELLMLFAGSAVLFLTLWRIRPGMTPIAPITLALAAGTASWIAFSRYGYLLDTTYPVLALAVIYLGQLYAGHARIERSRRRITLAFGQYLAPALVERLARAPEPPRLGGERREMTVMFADVRGFTALAERLKDQPERLTGLINRLLTPVSEAVLEQHGTIDKYIGDCLMAFWNAPLDDPRHAAHACAAALDMQHRIAKLNRALAHEAEREAIDGIEPLPIRLQMGIGIATGTCIVGNMGSQHRFNYSVLGDPVNVAARLEAATKRHAAGIIVAEATRALVPDFALLPLGDARLKGRGAAEPIHALIGDAALAGSDAFRALRDCHDAVLAALAVGDLRRAQVAAQQCLARRPDLEGLYVALLTSADGLGLLHPQTA